MTDRVTWFPIVHDFFTRMWPVTILALGGLTSMATRFRTLHPGERLLIAWTVLGTLELIARDVGNERYFVYLVPALVAAAALAIGRDRRLLGVADHPAKAAHYEYGFPVRLPIPLIVLTPVIAFALYVATGAIVRLAFRADVFAHELQMPVRLSAAIAGLLTLTILFTWPRLPRAWSRASWSTSASIALAILIVGIDLVQFGAWASTRTYKNYAAMREIGAMLPEGTLVHGKLANGLALESRIRPVFVGRSFGNYDDRLVRDDVPYVLTYVSPTLGYEGAVIREVLDAYPQRRVLRTFQVAETASGTDRAALFEKWPGAGQGRPR